MYEPQPIQPTFDDIMMAQQGRDPYQDGAVKPFDNSDNTLEQLIMQREAEQRQRMLDQQARMDAQDAMTYQGSPDNQQLMDFNQIMPRY